MVLINALEAPTTAEIITLDDHVKNSELQKNLRNTNSSNRFDYELNDKAATSKLLKAAKRVPIEEEENSTSSNLVLSAGAWYHVVLPSAKYFEDVKGEKTCKKRRLHVKSRRSKRRKRK